MKKTLLLATFIISSTVLLSQGGFRKLSNDSKYSNYEELRERKIQEIRKSYFDRNKQSLRSKQVPRKINPQLRGRRTTITYTRPSAGIFHYWNSGTQEWDYNVLKHYTYDTLGRLIGEYNIDSISNDTNNFYSTLYNENGNIVSSRNYARVFGNELVVMEKDSFEYHPIHSDFVISHIHMNYDLISESLIISYGYRYSFIESGGKVSSKIKEYHDGVDWNIENEDIFEYDMQGKLISKTMLNVNHGNKDTADRYTYFYSGNTVSYAERAYWNSGTGQFDNNEKFDSLSFANFNRPLADYEIFEYDLTQDGQLLNFVRSFWDELNTQWILSNKTIYSWDAQNVEIEMSWNGTEWIYTNRITTTISLEFNTNYRENYINNDWAPLATDTIIFSEFGEKLSEKYLNYNSSIQEWEIGWWNVKEREFDSEEKLISETEKIWQGSEFLNSTLENFQNWQTLTKEGPDTNTNVSQIVFSEIKLFPNPTSSSFTLVLDKVNSHISIVTIRNIEGKTLFNLTSQDNTIVVDMSSFSTGLYFVELLCEGQHKFFKIVKE